MLTDPFSVPPWNNDWYYPGQRCRINAVHHPVFADRVGRIVIISEANLDKGLAWASDDAPVRYRINRRGKTVVEYDPAQFRTLYRLERLTPISWRPDTTAEDIDER